MASTANSFAQESIPGSPPSLLGIHSHIWPAIIVTYAALMPRELAITIGAATMDPYRLALLASFPFILFRLFKAPPRLHWVDFVACLVAVWVMLSLIVHEPLMRAMETGAALSMDFILAYFLGRVSIRNTQDFRTLFMALLPGLGMVTLILIAESMAQRQLFRPFIASLLELPPPEIYDQVRMGLYRATGPFPHPILGGVFTATLLPIAWFAVSDQRLRALAILFACGMIFTVSTAAILAFLVGAGLIAIYHLQVRSGLPLIPLAIIACLTAVGLVLILSENGLLSFAARRISLSPASGQWRVLIWQYAGSEALGSPLFGIGLRDWVRPAWMHTDSIDAHFLLWSMRFGLPAGLGVFAVMLGSALHLLGSASLQTYAARKVSVGIAFSILAITLSGFTVALWEGIGAWMLMLCGIAVTLGIPPREPAAVRTAPLARDSRRG